MPLGSTFVYVDDTIGWRSVQSNEYATAGLTPAFIAATGGTVTTVCTNFKVHTFTGPGTFCVSSAGNAAGSNEVSYMEEQVVADQVVQQQVLLLQEMVKTELLILEVVLVVVRQEVMGDRDQLQVEQVALV